MMLDGKVALVTGGSRGIGREVCLTLARNGADVGLLDVDADQADKTAADVQDLGRRSKAFCADVTSPEQAEKVVEEMVSEFERIDILVNNAGITRDNLVLRMSPKEWDDVIAINLGGVFNYTAVVGRQMLRQRSGSIINMASVVALVGNPGQANYCASKAGVIGLTKAVARELAARSIRVNAIAPGFIKSHMTDAMSDIMREKMLASIPLKRPGTAADIAAVVLFLASDASSYITGQVIVVDGGMTMS